MSTIGASTYNFIATQTLGSATSSVTFNNIPQGYTDLVLVVQAKASASGGTYAALNFNSDTASNYSRTNLIGDGSSATSSRNSNETALYMATISLSTTNFTTIISSIMNYANTSTYKTVLNRISADTVTQANVGLWRGTSAITSLSVNIGVGSVSYAAGSTFSLYGIKAADVTSIIPTKAFGGDVIATDGTYTYHAFKTTGAFIPAVALTADVLVVSGGGGGGSGYFSGGGGAGGVLAFSSQSLTAGTSYTCNIGAGGAGGSYTYSYNGIAGNNSQFAALTAPTGGGYGAGIGGSSGQTGGNGGSGGGGQSGTSGAGSGGTGTSGQGNNGSGGVTQQDNYPSKGSGGGGGGAGGAASAGTVNTGGSGGAGTNSVTNWGSLSTMFITTNLGFGGYIAGGGGGGQNYISGTLTNGGPGGSGGGGIGGVRGNTSGGNAWTNTGSGGGGGSQESNTGGGGGASGLIVVRYTS